MKEIVIMISDNALRNEIKLLKAFQGINYKDISQKLGIKQRSFYAWIKADFNLSSANKYKLSLIINEYKGG